MVENPTDEDWSTVTMALVSGRPISFKMDLYNPLYVQRPTVEPELFASLRPPTYSGAMNKLDDRFATRGPRRARRSGFGDEQVEDRLPGMPASEPSPRRMVRGLAIGVAKAEHDRLNYAREVSEKLERSLELGASVHSVATASSLGDYFQYVIDRPVDLSRQKSAMLPIVNKDVEGKRVSIYNQSVQAKHPLLGLQFKNTTGMPLTQGPITVFEGSVYAGDTRVLDLQPDEERLVSYAIDLGTEVSGQARQQHVADHERESRQGHRLHEHHPARRTRVRHLQSLDDRSHAADRASEPQGPGLHLRRRAQAEGRGSRRVPLRAGGACQEGSVLHGHRRTAARLHRCN